ncbi:ion channel-forming bestrophin family protein, partial [Phenoliferia sp. Uapishka_3]
MRSHSHRQSSIANRIRHSNLVALGHLAIWSRVQLPVLIATAWASVVWLLHSGGIIQFGGGAASLTAILSMVTGLMVSFRSGSSYDRWYEGRRTWSSIQSTSRNTLRLLLFALPSSTSSQPTSSASSGINELCSLICAFSIATLHHLRDQSGINYPDLQSLLPPSFLSVYAPSTAGHAHLKREVPQNLPLVIVSNMHQRLNNLKAEDLIDAGTCGASQSALNSFTEQLTALERIRDTPIPAVLEIHLQLLLLVYIGAVPLQLVKSLGIWSIPATRPQLPNSVIQLRLHPLRSKIMPTARPRWPPSIDIKDETIPSDASTQTSFTGGDERTTGRSWLARDGDETTGLSAELRERLAILVDECAEESGKAVGAENGVTLDDELGRQASSILLAGDRGDGGESRQSSISGEERVDFGSGRRRESKSFLDRVGEGKLIHDEGSERNLVAASDVDERRRRPGLENEMGSGE